MPSGGWKKYILSFGVPTLITAGVMGGIVIADRYLHENPDLKERLEIQQMARLASHADMSNPWGTYNADDPSSFLMTLFVGTSPELREKFQKALAKLSAEKLQLLSAVLGAIDFTQDQKDKFARLMVVALSGDKGTEKISRALDIFERLGASKVGAKKSQGEEPGSRGTGGEVLAPDGQTPPGQQPQFQKAELTELASPLLVFLEVQEPAKFDRVLDVLISLSPDVYDSVMGVITDLSPQYTGQLIEVFNDMSTEETQTVTGVLGRVNNLPPLLDKLLQLNTSDIASTSASLENVSTADLNTLVGMLNGFNDSQFGSLVEVLDSTDNAGTFIGVGAKVGSQVFADATEVAAVFDGENLSNLIEIMDGIKTDAVEDLVTVFNKMDESTAEKSISVLDKLNTDSIQEDLLEEATFLKGETLRKGVEVMDDIDTGSVVQMVQLSKGLNEADVKNELADQMHLLHGLGDGVIAGIRSEEEFFSIREPTAVAGVRGKVIDEYVVPSYSRGSEDYAMSRNRVMRLLFKMTIIDDFSIVRDLLKESAQLSKRSLARGAEVFINLDTGPGKTRARRLVDTYKRLDLNYKETAIDTMHDLDTYEHVNAALDSGHLMDDELLKDSIWYTENLRYRLGQEEGVAATKRLINVASLVNTNEDRRKGLDALQQESEVRVRRMLKQVDGHKDIFDGPRVVRMTNVYHELKDEFLNAPAGEEAQDRAVKLADALSGSEGVTLGSKGRSGASRYVTQETKLMRIGEYLSGTDAKLDNAVNFVTERAVQVTHTREDDFPINTPELVRDEDGQVVELIYKAGRTSPKNF